MELICTNGALIGETRIKCSNKTNEDTQKQIYKYIQRDGHTFANAFIHAERVTSTDFYVNTNKYTSKDKINAQVNKFLYRTFACVCVWTYIYVYKYLQIYMCLCVHINLYSIYRYISIYLCVFACIDI